MRKLLALVLLGLFVASLFVGCSAPMDSQRTQTSDSEDSGMDTPQSAENELGLVTEEDTDIGEMV